MEIIKAVHETIEQLRPNEEELQTSSTGIHSFTLDTSEDTAMDLLKMQLEDILRTHAAHLSEICRKYLLKFLQQYDYDENTRKFTNSFNMDSLDPFEHDLEAALASIDAFVAAYMGNKDAVLKFIEKYPTLKDKPGLHGTTLLYSAAKNNHEVLVRFLVQSAHCAINAQNQQQLEDVLQTHSTSTFTMINPSSGSTALHGACFQGHLRIVQYLITHGADYFVRNQLQETPIMNGENRPNIRDFFKDFLILGYSVTTTKHLPEKPILQRTESETFDCVWEYKPLIDQQWLRFSDDESNDLNKSLTILSGEEMQRVIYLGASPNTFSVSMIQFTRSDRNRDPTKHIAWVRCRGSSIFNFDCFSRWQIMLLKYTEITSQNEPSLKIIDIPTIYDSKFQLQLNCWYNCTSNINSHLDNAINYRRKRITLNLQFLTDDVEFDLQDFTFASRDRTISGCIRWIPKLIANDERYRNTIHDIDNYQNLSHVQPIPLTTKRLQEISNRNHTTSASKLDDDILEEDENDQDVTPRSLLSENIDEDSFDAIDKEIESSENGKWSLFDIKSKDDTALTAMVNENDRHSSVASLPSTISSITEEKSLADNLQEELTNTVLSQEMSLQENLMSIENLKDLENELRVQQLKIDERTKEMIVIKEELRKKNEEKEKLENELATAQEKQMEAQQQKKHQANEMSKLEAEINELKAAQDTLIRTKQKANRELSEKLAAAQAKHDNAEQERKRQAKEISDLAKKIKDIEAIKEELKKKNEDNEKLENELAIAQKKHAEAQQQKERQANEMSKLEADINELKAAQNTFIRMKQKADQELSEKLAAAQAKHDNAEQEKKRQAKEISDLAEKIKEIEANKEELRKKNEEETQNLDKQLKIAEENQRIAEQEKQRQQQQIEELDKLTKELKAYKEKEEKEKNNIEKIEKTIIANQYSKIETQIARDFLAPKQSLILDYMKKTGKTVDKYFIDRIPKMLLGEVINESTITYTVMIIGFQDHHNIFKELLARMQKYFQLIQKAKDYYQRSLQKITKPIQHELTKVKSRTQYWKQYVKSLTQLIQDQSNEYTELFNTYIEEIGKSLTERCILNDLTTIKTEIEKHTNNFMKNKLLIKEVESLKHQALENFIEQNITFQRSHHEKKPSIKSLSVLETLINRVKTDFKTNQKFIGLDAKHFALIPDLLHRLIMYYCCFNIQLPLFESALDLLDKIDMHTVTTIATSTGSGKSTLLPALLAAEGYDKIIVTQPRRLPCTLICQRVNETMTTVTDPFSEKLAGWAVSGAEKNPRAKVLYVTDGLLKERLLYDENFITRNTQLNKSIIFFIDEVHERSVNIDYCLALLARMLSVSPALKSKMKLIISSATLDSSVPKLFRQIKQITLAEFEMPQMGTIHTVTKYPRPKENILSIVQELYQKRRRHDQILCFVSSVKDVNECCTLLKKITGDVIIAHPLIQSQQASTQKEYIENGSVFFSTTVAETSLTFPQLKYVIDTGMINIPVYDPESKRTVLKEERAAESTIKQRLGRLGRTQPGDYYSLYDFKVDDKQYPTSQICQLDLTNIEFALRKSPLKKGLNYMKEFFPDRPSDQAIDLTIKELRALGIVEASPSEKFTKHGEALANLPDFGSLQMSKCVLAALQKYSCGRDLIYLASILSVLNTSALLKPIPKNLKSADGDFMTLFNVMQEILLVKQSVPENKFNLQLVCQAKGLSDIHHILRQALRRYTNLERSFNSLVEYRGPSQITSGDWPSIAKSLLSGYYKNVFVSLKELSGRNHHYVQYDSNNTNIAVLDSQSTLARHLKMSPVPIVLARDIRYSSSIRSRAILSFVGELRPEWVEYELERNLELNIKEVAHLNDHNRLSTAMTKFYQIHMQMASNSLLLTGKAGTTLNAELHLRQQLAVEQPEFPLENHYKSGSVEYTNLSRNLESVMKMTQIFQPMTGRWEAEKQVKITVNPNTSTKTITVKVVGRDSDYENVKQEFNAFLSWLGCCAVIRHPNSVKISIELHLGVPPRVFRPQVRKKYHDIEERISHITDNNRTIIDLYKGVKGPNATRETRMEVVAWIAVCKFSCKLEGGFVRDWIVGNDISRPANPLPSPKHWIEYIHSIPYINKEVVPGDLDCHLPTHAMFDIEKFQDELHKYDITCQVFRENWRYVLLIDENAPTGPFTMDLIEPHVALTHDRIDFDVNNLSLEKYYTHELGMRIDIQQRPYLIELETIVDNIKNKRFQVLRPLDYNLEQRIDKMVNIRHWTQLGHPFSVVPNPDPKYWSVLVRLPSSDKLYKDVEAQIRNIGNTVTIISIEQIKNPLLEDQYEALKKIIAKQCSGFDPNERELFHGTSGEGIDGIRDNGFDDRYFSKDGNWGKYFVNTKDALELQNSFS
ncbi:unnamed protein product [Rotaria sp. Silwood1]|nr:unnamed protein product [Rotaria sp. Silwood1]CAF1458131.1 unnamed protein product [Rotaria sp. Silwood1]CAF3586824.1 unnamed protein product [Rotaria sp. Silwood1]CAF3628073.1 unnamed protein product [Rotaria sp. Silwood1]CAF3632708.1 unnamed protein product [Rotaria sp. Silwood1]